MTPPYGIAHSKWWLDMTQHAKATWLRVYRAYQRLGRGTCTHQCPICSGVGTIEVFDDKEK